MREHVAEHEELVHAVFMEALESPPSERSAFVTRACQDDTFVADEVRQLLSLHDRLTQLDGPLDLEDAIGSRVGQYEIIRLLGSGAMGCVYLARRADGLYNKDVAIKIMGVPGRFAPDLRSRFESERRILASLRHPGIASLLDAGQMADARLYFIMEYIDGLPLTGHCKQHRLSAAEKVQLFLLVCEAVAYAHRSLVVHRDLKPANIIVTADGEPRLLDFGIAKFVTRAAIDPDPTDPSMRRATPAYASPEQLAGRPTHTSMDIYSLGIILHELLTGCVPQGHGASSPDPEDTVRSEANTAGPPFGDTADIARVAVLALERDLRAIIGRAIAPEWQSRYLSVDDLITDLRAWAAGMPVAATQGGWAYRSTKWLRRNMFAALTGAVASVSIVVAAFLALNAWKADREARASATRQLQAARMLAGDVLSMDGTLAQIAGTTAVRRAAVSSLSRYLTDVDVTGSEELALDVARAYRRLGDVEGNPNVPNLGNRAAAQAHYARALGILESFPPERTTWDRREALVETYTSQAEVYFAERRFDEATTRLERALALATLLVNERPASPATSRLAGTLHRTLGDVRLAEGDPRAALLEYERALAADARLLTQPGGQSDDPRLRALTQLRLGDAKASLGAFDGAREAYEEASTTLQGLAQDTPQKRVMLRDAALGLGRLSQLLAQREPQRAADVARRGIATLEDLERSDPADARARRDLMVALLQYAELTKPFDGPASHSAVLRGLGLARRAYAEAPSDVSRREDLRRAEARLAAASTGDLVVELARDSDARPVDAGGSPVFHGDRLRVRAARAPAGWARYLLLFGAHGPGQLLDQRSSGARGWSIAATGPGAAQTLILIVAPEPLDATIRGRILKAVETLPTPRLIDFDSHIVWAERSETIVSAVSTRGLTDISWARELRRRLATVGSLRYDGRTIPLAQAGF